jgi:hypothetical protein
MPPKPLRADAEQLVWLATAESGVAWRSGVYYERGRPANGAILQALDASLARQLWERSKELLPDHRLEQADTDKILPSKGTTWLLTFSQEESDTSALNSSLCESDKASGPTCFAGRDLTDEHTEERPHPLERRRRLHGDLGRRAAGLKRPSRRPPQLNGACHEKECTDSGRPVWRCSRPRPRMRRNRAACPLAICGRRRR